MGQGTSQPTQSARVPIDRLSLHGRGPVKKCKKSSLSFNSLAFSIEGYVFSIEVQSSTGQNLTITWHAFIVQRLVNQLTPISTSWGYFLEFWLSRLENYKLTVSLHLCIRDHLHLFVYLLVLDSKVLILFLVH